MTTESQKQCANALAKVLANTYILYLKTHNFHWNVRGPNFRSLHMMFEEQYQDMWAALDVVAERIRALGEYAPGTYAKFSQLASIKSNEDIPNAKDMVDELIADNQAVVESITDAIKIAQEAGDEPSAGLLTERQTIHEKAIWMMRATQAA